MKRGEKGEVLCLFKSIREGRGTITFKPAKGHPAKRQRLVHYKGRTHATDEGNPALSRKKENVSFFLRTKRPSCAKEEVELREKLFLSIGEGKKDRSCTKAGGGGEIRFGFPDKRGKRPSRS